jgi:hypothetical protein
MQGAMKLCTYNLAFFFGPGLPLTLGTASVPNATPELLLTPFFLTPSVGGGIDEGTGVPLVVAGVFEADSDGLSPCELAAAGSEFEVVGEESFDGTSSFMSGAGPNFDRASGDSFNVTINAPLDDFRRAVEVVDSCLTGAMVREDAMRERRARELRCRSQVGRLFGLPQRRNSLHPQRSKGRNGRGRVLVIRRNTAGFWEVEVDDNLLGMGGRCCWRDGGLA